MIYSVNYLCSGLSTYVCTLIYQTITFHIFSSTVSKQITYNHFGLSFEAIEPFLSPKTKVQFWSWQWSKRFCLLQKNHCAVTRWWFFYSSLLSEALHLWGHSLTFEPPPSRSSVFFQLREAKDSDLGVAAHPRWHWWQRNRRHHGYHPYGPTSTTSSTTTMMYHYQYHYQHHNQYHYQHHYQHHYHHHNFHHPYQHLQ